MKKAKVSSTTGASISVLARDRVGFVGSGEEVIVVDEIAYCYVRTSSGLEGFILKKHLSSFEKQPLFVPVKIEHERLLGDECVVNEPFSHRVYDMIQCAKDNDVKIWVTNSLRHWGEKVDGAIVAPASNSCHHIGHAIDINVWYKDKLYTSNDIKQDNWDNLPACVWSFMVEVDQIDGLRWGDSFNDPVHFDDNLYHRDQRLYEAIKKDREEQENV